MPFTEQVLYGIAAGFDADESERINIQEYDPGVIGGSPFGFLHSYGTYSPGSLIIRADQSFYFAGFPSVQWVWSWLDYANEKWAMDTFANGGYAGNVTIWCTTDTPNEVQKFNAKVRFPVLASTQQYIPGYRDLAWTFILQEQLEDMLLFTSTANKVVANSAAETSLIGTGVGSLTLAAAFLTVGKTLRVTAYGFISNTGTPTFAVKFKLGSTIICASGAITTPSGVTNVLFSVDLLLTCRTIGASGTVIAAGEVCIGGVPTGLYPTSGAVSVVDCTGTLAVDLTGQWGAADAANTVSVVNFVLAKEN